MQYNQPFDQPTLPNAAFVNGNPGTGVAGSIPPAAQMEFPQREIVNAEMLAGLTPINGDLTQLAQAMSIGLWLGPIGGSANALADVLPTLATTSDGVTQYAIPALLTGMTFHGIVAATNTGPATLTLTGFGTAPGAKPIVRKDGTPVQAGDILANALVSFRFDGTAFRVTSMVPSDLGGPAAAAYYGIYLGADTSTTANQVVLTSTNYPSALQVGRPFTFKVATANTGATTIAINGAAAVPLRYRNNQALPQGELLAGDIILAEYNDSLNAVVIAGAPRVQSAPLKAQLAPTDIIYDSNAAANYQSVYAGTSMGSFTLPVGFSCIQLSANVFVVGDNGSSPTGTGLYMAIWSNANDGTGWIFRESQRTYKAANASAVSYSRTSLLTLDPTKSYTFDVRLLKDTATSNATAPSGNLLGLALRF